MDLHPVGTFSPSLLHPVHEFKATFYREDKECAADAPALPQTLRLFSVLTVLIWSVLDALL